MCVRARARVRVRVCVCVCVCGCRGVNRTPSTIHLIDMIFGTCNDLPFYFRLSATTRCLIGFHGNDKCINDVTSDRHLGFLSQFQILSKFELEY